MTEPDLTDEATVLDLTDETAADLRDAGSREGLTRDAPRFALMFENGELPFTCDKNELDLIREGAGLAVICATTRLDLTGEGTGLDLTCDTNGFDLMGKMLE